MNGRNNTVIISETKQEKDTITQAEQRDRETERERQRERQETERQIPTTTAQKDRKMSQQTLFSLKNWHLYSHHLYLSSLIYFFFFFCLLLSSLLSVCDVDVLSFSLFLFLT
jgi:hypothetical protein